MTPSEQADSTRRFSNRAGFYAAYRPKYPDSVIDHLKRDAGLGENAVIADVGSGTGNSAELFLRHGHEVYGVEPNREMRFAAEGRLQHFPKFHSISGTAEDTSLPDACVDWVISASSFHWFDARLARAEFQRILRPDGTVLLMGNLHRKTGSEFMAAYSGIFRKYSERNRAYENREERIRELFAPHGYQTAALKYHESLDLGQLSGRLLSYSSIPLSGQPGHDAMMQELRDAFERASENGRVPSEGEVTLHWGRLS